MPRNSWRQWLGVITHSSTPFACYTVFIVCYFLLTPTCLMPGRHTVTGGPGDPVPEVYTAVKPIVAPTQDKGARQDDGIRKRGMVSATLRNAWPIYFRAR